MVEKRGVPRRKPGAIITVFDEITGKDLGHLANLTPEGLMLVSREPIRLSSIFQMRIEVPPSAKRVDKVCFGAESVWASQMEGEGGYFWSGFSIIDISGEAADFIERWIEDWTVDSE
jgi:hypothetical protein